MNANLACQEEAWEEMLNGRLVLMSPRPATNHNRTAFNIAKIFDNYLEGKKCTAFPDGEELYLTQTDRFIPDGMIVCDPAKIKYDGVHGAPDLVVEVLSPSTAKNDKGYKKEAYAQAGVKEYWIVNPVDKSVEQYLLADGQLALHEVYSVYPDFMLARMTEEERAAVITEFKCSLYDDLTISLQDIFKRTI